MTVSGGLLERDGVIEAVAGLAGAVGAGRAGALFVVGEAGLGKTAVLGYGRDLAAAAGLRVGFGRGHPMEGALPFGVLVQVLDAAGGQRLLQEGQPGAARHGDRRRYKMSRMACGLPPMWQSMWRPAGSTVLSLPWVKHSTCWPSSPRWTW